MTYPVPSYAANIWIVGDKLWIGFPSQVEGARAHNVAFPITVKGLEAAITILKHRNDSEPREIGTKGAPTGVEIEKALASDKAYNEFLQRMKTEQVDNAELTKDLEELGL